VTGGRALHAGLALVAPALCLALPAEAQVAGRATLATDYRLRGISLTDRQPALTLGLAYDHTSGLYAGGSVVGQVSGEDDARVVGHTAQVGFARRLASGPTWDVGVNHVDMSLRLDRTYSIDYTEAYVGLAQGAFSARAHLAPDFPRRGLSTAYLDLGGAWRPADAWRVSTHLGVLSRLGALRPQDGRRTRYDLSLAVAREFRDGEVHLTWTMVEPRPEPRSSASGAGLTLGVTLLF
jgi:uncharacterized protein (TIGR02001 family)